MSFFSSRSRGFVTAFCALNSQRIAITQRAHTTFCALNSQQNARTQKATTIPSTAKALDTGTKAAMSGSMRRLSDLTRPKTRKTRMERAIWFGKGTMGSSVQMERVTMKRSKQRHPDRKNRRSRWAKRLMQISTTNTMLNSTIA